MPANYGGSTVDERVVEMRIDNKQFEKGAKTTISTLEKLEKALNIKSKTDVIDDLADSVSRFDASPISDAFTEVTNNISAKGVFIKRLIENLTDDIYQFARKTLKELTVDQVSAGMDKYTQLAETTQMLMASTRDNPMFAGKDDQYRMDYLEEQLKRILWYSDETSYSFTEMGSTAAKIMNTLGNDADIEQVFTAMMGIASWGAASGADASKVNQVMQYSIAQAMGMGSMKTLDWKTIENANMGTDEFKKNVIAVAYELGKIKPVRLLDDETTDAWTSITDPDRFNTEGYIKDLKKSEEEAIFTAKNFREGLNTGWFDMDVMMEVFSRYGEFANRLQKVSEETGESASNIKDILDVYRSGGDLQKYAEDIFGTAEKTKDLLEMMRYLDEVQWDYSERGFWMGQEYKTWKDVVDYIKDAVSSNWMQIFKTIFGNYLEAKELWSEIGGRLEKIFVDPLRTLNEILAVWKDSGGRDALINGFRNLADAAENLISPVVRVIKTLLGLNDVDKTGNRLAKVTKAFEAVTTVVLKVSEGISFVLNLIGDLVEFITSKISVIKLVKLTIKGIVNLFEKFTGLTKENRQLLNEFLGGLLTDLKTLIDQIKIEDVIKTIKDTFKDLFPDLEKIGSKLKWLKDIIVDFIFGSGTIEDLSSALQVLKTSILTAFTGLFAGHKQEGEKTVLDWIIEKFQAVKTKMAEWKQNAKSLGEFLGNIFNGIMDLISKISFKDVWNTIKASFTDFFTTISNSKFITAIKDKLGSALESIKPFFTEKWQSLINFILKVLGKDTTEQLQTALTRSGMPVSKPSFIEWLNNLLPFNLSNIKEWLLSLLPFSTEGLLANAPQINWEQVLMKVLNVGSILAGIKALRGLGKVENAFAKMFKTVDLNEALKRLTSPTSELGNLIKMFTDKDVGLPSLFSAVKGFLNKGTFRIEHKKIDSFGTTVLKLAAAIAILAGVVYVLSKMKVEDATKALTILGAIASGLLVFGILAKLTRIDGKPVLMLAAALALLMIPLKILAKMSWNDMIKGMLAIGILLAELSVFTRLGSKNNFSKDNTVPFIKMALALLILTIPLKKLAKLSWNDLSKGIIGIGLLMTELSVAMKLMGNGISKENTTPFIKLALAVLVLAYAVKAISKMNTEELIKGLGAVTILIFGIAGAMRAMKGVGSVKGFLPLVIAVAILAIAMKKIAKLSIGEMIKGALGLGVIMFMLATVMSSVRGMKLSSSLSGLLLVIGTLAAFIIAFRYLDSQNVNFDKVLKFAASISAIMLSFGVMIKLLSKVPFVTGLAAIGLFAIFIAAIGALVYGLGKLGEAFEGLDATMEKGVELFGYIGRAIGSFVGGIISGAWEIIFGNFDLPQLGTDLSVFSENVKPFVENMKGIDSSVTDGAGALAGAIIAIVGAEFLNKIASIFSEDLVSKFARHITLLGQALKSYSTSIKGISDAQTDSDNALTIATGLNNLIKEIDKEGGILSWITGHPDVEGFGEDVGYIADGLTTFATKIQGISDLASAEDISKATTAAEGLAALNAALPAEGGVLQAFIGVPSLESFGSGISSVAGGLSLYAEAIGGISGKVSDDDIKSATTVATGLVSLEQSLPDEGGLLQKIVGWKNLAGFGEGVKVVATGLYAYALAVGGFASINSKDIKMATEVAQGLAKVQNSLPETGGWIQTFFGEQSLSNFGSQLEALGEGLYKYAYSILGISKTATNDDLAIAKSTASGLTDLQNSLPSTGGILQEWLGEKNLSSFGASLQLLGEGLYKYAFAVMGISGTASDGDLALALSIATNLNDLNNALPETGGVRQWLTGEQNMGLFASNVALLGTALHDFAANIKGVDSTDADNSINILTSINTFIEELDKSGGILDAVAEFVAGNKYNTLLSLTESMKTVGDNLRAFSESMETVNSGDVDYATELVTAIQGFIDGLEKSGGFTGAWVDFWTGSKWNNLLETAENMASFGTYFKTFTDGLKGASKADTDFQTAQQLVTDFITLASLDVESDGGTMYAIAYLKAFEVPQALADGLNDNSQVYYDALTKVATGTSESFESLADAAHTSGWNIDAGIAQGIYDGSFMPISAMQALADSIMSGFNDPLGIESPSKVMMQSGLYVVQGLAHGINQNESEAIDSIVILGDAMVLAMQKAMFNVAMMADEDYDIQPTISPVVDMSNADAASREIGDLFSGTNIKDIFDSQSIDGASITTTIHSKDVVAELKNLNTRMEIMDESLKNLGIYLDTGVLVGGIAAKMDNKLGVMTARKGRGN